MRYLVVGGWLLVTVIGSALASDSGAGADGRLRVATFCSDATPPLGSPTYPSGKPLETVETPLLAKGIVLDDGRQRIVLCVIDWCGLCGPAHSLVREKLAAGAGTDVSHVTVHTVHQHTAPYVPIEAWEPQDQAGKTAAATPGPVVQQMAERLSAAAKQSLGRLQPFNAIGFGQAQVVGAELGRLAHFSKPTPEDHHGKPTPVRPSSFCIQHLSTIRSLKFRRPLYARRRVGHQSRRRGDRELGGHLCAYEKSRYNRAVGSTWCRRDQASRLRSSASCLCPARFAST